jgi:hypothetical protein
MEKSRIRDKHPGSATLISGDPQPRIVPHQYFIRVGVFFFLTARVFDRTVFPFSYDIIGTSS